MRNWHNKIIKLIPLLLFVFGFGQSGKYFLRDSVKRIDENRLEREIIKDFKNVNFESLKRKIIKEIDVNKLPQKNIFFNYTNYSYDVSRIFIDLNDASGPLNNFKNPAFNQKDFWTLQTLKKLCRKTGKNLIPSLSSDEIEDIEEFKKNLQYNYSKKDPFYILLHKFKRGILIINNEDGIVLNKEFYFFSTKDKSLKIIQKGNAGFENLSNLNLEFSNYLNKIVEVKFIYNDYEIVKTYQYQNKIWIEIPKNR